VAVYALRRLVVTVPLLLAVSFLVFAVVTAFPGDPCRLKLGQRPSPEALRECRSALKLDQPFLLRYVDFVEGAVRLDFGRDFLTNEPVGPVILQKLSATVELTVFALLIAVLLGITVGTLSALRPGSWIDAMGQLLSLGGVSIPVFWLGMLLIALFGVKLGWLPFGGYPQSVIGPGIHYHTSFLFTESLCRLQFAAAGRAFAHLVLPSVALSTIPLATITRMTRSSVLEEVGHDYVTTARAKGLSEGRILRAHVLRNALVPIVTITGLQLGVLLSGAVLTETVFSWPGMGTHMVKAATQRNYPVIMGCMLLFVVIFVLVNLVVDLLYHWIDPRMREAGTR
jgi:peptide/nickel transport system permease protein